MGRYLYFGEKIRKYDVRVLNEREVRAGAGILFFFAIIAFMNAWITGNFYYTKIFVIAFLMDFFIRVFINPKYSPSLIIGRFMVRNQAVEYVGASQKRFAWGIGFALAVVMFFLLVLNNVIGPVNLLTCMTCLLLLFFEAAFGICIGCMIYNLFSKEKAELCPGGVCKDIKKESIQKISIPQLFIVLLFILLVLAMPFFPLLSSGTRITAQTSVDFTPINASNSTDCQPPGWAVAMGHAELWKLHHGCS